MTARSIPLTIDQPRRQTATCRECGGPTERSLQMQGIAKCPACCDAYKPPTPAPVLRAAPAPARNLAPEPATVPTAPAPEPARTPTPFPPPEEPPMPAPAAEAPAFSDCPIHPGAQARTGGLCHPCGQLLRVLAKTKKLPRANTVSLEVLRFARMEEITRWNCYPRLKAMRDALDAGAEPDSPLPLPDRKPKRAPPTRTTPPSDRTAEDIGRAADLIESARTLLLVGEAETPRMAEAALAEAQLELEESVHGELVATIAEAIARALRAASEQAVVRARVALS